MDGAAADNDTADADFDVQFGAKDIACAKDCEKNCSEAEISCLRRLHANLGHPSNEDLCRSLRLRGAKAHVVEAARRLACRACRKMKAIPTRRPARLHFVGDFADDVGFDCFEIKDSLNHSFHFFSIVDLATTVHVAVLIDNHSSAHFAEIFDRVWACWAGAPVRAHFDK